MYASFESQGSSGVPEGSPHAPWSGLSTYVKVLHSVPERPHVITMWYP